MNLPPLLEREGELRALGEAIERAKEEAGQTVLIEGTAGAGKSALMSAACARAGDEGVRVLRARGSEVERDFAFGTVRQLFEPVVTSAGTRQRERLLAGSAAPAEWVVDGASALDTTRARAEAGPAVLHAIYWLTANLAAECPLLIAVDDLHWVDVPSLRSLAYLGKRVSDLPIALLTALRPSEPDAPAALLDELRSQPEMTRVAPSALGRESVGALVRAQLPDADAELCEAFHEASAGNPLYLHELLLVMGVENLAASPDAAAHVRQASVPTLGERLSRRIARVDPEAEALTHAMAVLGDGGPLRFAAALAGIDEETAARIALRLSEIEVLERDDPFTFAHPVLRRTVYDSLSATEREAAHSAAAELLHGRRAPPEAIAAHVSALSPARSQTTATTLLEAARQALSRSAPEAAIPLLRRALAEDAAEPSRAALLLELGKAEMALRDPSAIGHLQEAYESAEDPHVRALGATLLAELLSAAGRWEEGLEVVNAAKREAGDPGRVVELEAMRAVMMSSDPRFVETFDRERPRLIELSKGESWGARALAAVLAPAAALRCRSSETVMALAEHALAGGHLIAERDAGSWAMVQALWGLAMTAEYERVIEIADQVTGEARRLGSLMGVATGGFCRGQAFSRMGDLRAAEAELRSVLGLAVESGMALWVVSAFHACPDAILERPQLADVAELTKTLELDPVFLNTMGGGALLELRGRLALAAGDRDGALADLDACAVTFRALRLGPTWSPWRSVLALALPAEDHQRADSLVGEELRLARASGIAHHEGVTLRAAGLLARGDRGVGLLRQSVSTLERTTARLEHARSLVELGAALRRRNRRAEGREHLAAGMSLAEACGADRLVARAGDELRAAGARPRRTAQAGADSLTPSELRVARLAAWGRSNPDIAQELYVSTKTVETHLSAVYGKLGLSGRGARERLAEVLSPVSAR